MTFQQPLVDALPRSALIIGESREEAGSGQRLAHVYPGNGSVTREIKMAGADDVDRAVAAARAAFPAWRAMPGDKRRDLFFKLAALFEAKAVDFVPSLVAENGSISFAAAALLANDSDPNGDALTITGAGAASGGAVTFNAQTGGIIFTPTANYTGPASFGYAISDGRGGIGLDCGRRARFVDGLLGGLLARRGLLGPFRLSGLGGARLGLLRLLRRVDLLGHGVAVARRKFGESVHESSFTHLGNAADAARTRESLKLRKAQAAEGGAVPHGVGGGGGVGHDWILSPRGHRTSRDGGTARSGSGCMKMRETADGECQ